MVVCVTLCSSWLCWEKVGAVVPLWEPVMLDCVVGGGQGA